MHINLNGSWQVGENRKYSGLSVVPGLASAPCEMNKGTLWYKRVLALPEGNWSCATLLLKGARFSPSVYINGNKMSETAGGMTTTTHLLQGPDIRPGNTLVMEIALKSLSEIGDEDASSVPAADRWRTNISSCLWDDVILNLHGNTRIARVIPYSDINNDSVTIQWGSVVVVSAAPCTYNWKFEIIDQHGEAVAQSEIQVDGNTHQGGAVINLKGACKQWTPEEPVCYTLRTSLYEDGELSDQDEMTFGFRNFSIEGIGFRLNNKPLKFRSGTVVWHRWVRDPEARTLAFDTDWFEKNIVLRLKSHGANGLRFHLGNPPEKFLDLCDRHGLIVQIEWHFFHGMPAKKESLLDQWRRWLNFCMRHPSVCIIHPWNETEGEELETAFSAISELEKEYPPLVISHRDVIHIHKYWWSMFENVGLYYDSAEQFPLPIIADEFGGNYLDGYGNPGAYPALKESFLRFLGRNHTTELRLQLHAESNTQIAEYWRRIGAAGFSPFCALGSTEDGNHHFLGKLVDGRPKEVWSGLTASFSPLSCSLEVWDRNYTPGQQVRLPLYFMNDTEQAATLVAEVRIVSEVDPSEVIVSENVSCHVAAYHSTKVEVSIQLPSSEGEWRYQAILQNKVPGVSHPIVSSWRFRTLKPIIPAKLKSAVIAMPEAEEELKTFLTEHGVEVCGIDDSRANILAFSAASWDTLQHDKQLRARLGHAIDSNQSVLIMGIGPRKLGQGYLEDNDVGPLQKAPTINEPEIVEVELFQSVRLRFRELPEPESCIHPADANDPDNMQLWDHLPKQATWLWNGLRGGLIVPACDMEPIGLRPSAFLEQWQSRGADPQLIEDGNYFAHEMAGYYEFSVGNFPEAVNELRRRVKFLVEDAPALQYAINPNVKVRTYNLSKMYMESREGKAEKLIPLASAGKNLTRTPVVKIEFGEGKGKVILSQTMINGRLSELFGEPDLYGLRKDPAASQFVINLLTMFL